MISIANDFSRFPAGRFVTDGRFSGERFRGEFLVPALNEAGRVIVNLDGTLGYGSSFLEEAFGGLVRECGFLAQDLQGRLVLTSRDPSIHREIWGYITSAKPARRA